MRNATETDRIADAGDAWYQKLRTQLEPAEKGKYVVINVETGEYEIDADYLSASDRAMSRWPHARRFAARIGYEAMCRIGSTSGARR